VKAKLEMIAANDFTPQMQLSHALKDARLALEAAEDTQLPILATIADCWDDAADEICRSRPGIGVCSWRDGRQPSNNAKKSRAYVNSCA
jgi:3-hydroxyisobutyrate dehydrogenase